MRKRFKKEENLQAGDGASVKPYIRQFYRNNRAMCQYKELIFAKIMEKNMEAFSDENTSLYLSALTNDASSIETNYLFNVFKLVQEILLFFGAFAMMLCYNPALTLAAVAISLLPVLASLFSGKRLAVLEKEVSGKNEKFVTMLKDTLSGFGVVKSFQTEKEIQKLLSGESQGAEVMKCRRRTVQAVIETMGTLTGAAAQFGVFLMGAYFALRGQGITAGTVIVFVQLMNYVITPIAEVPALLANRKAARALMEKLAVALDKGADREETMQECTKAVKIPAATEKKAAEIELKHVSFAYEKDIFGAVSVVQQNVFVFNSSIKNNITMFWEFEESRLWRAIELSGLKSLVESKGMEYPCGENGCGLSGGERQRLAIARCLLCQTPVLVADEATAALDKATAYSLMSSLLALPGLMRIIITHDLEMELLKKYDEILVIKDGRIHERGTFEELMTRREYFYSLYTVAQ